MGLHHSKTKQIIGLAGNDSTHEANAAAHQTITHETAKKSDGSPTAVKTASTGSSGARVPNFRAVNTQAAQTWAPQTSEGDVREYHAISASKYMLPKDSAEQNRLETQSLIFRAAFDGDVICPSARERLATGSGAKVLDVGCAQGFWLRSVQAEYPDAEYFGVDIATDILESSEKISLQYGNVLEGLPYEDNTFDYVHQRLLVLGMPKEKFVDAIKELIRVTKPGGYIELFESDVVFYSPGPYSKILGGAMFDAMHRRGLECHAAMNLPWYVSQVSENVEEKGSIIKSFNLNWGGEFGKVWASNVRAGYSGTEDWLTKVMGITREDYRNLVQNCFDEWEEHKSFFNTRAVYFKVKK